VAKILLAEDESIVQLVLSETLAENGHEVVAAHNGERALALMEPGIELIVSDLMMPRMGGAEWVAEARRRSGVGNVPVIFMSALPLSPEARTLSSHFLRKPFHTNLLIKAVQHVLSGMNGHFQK
jgi:two-component system chemotaxis response regulator CheY